MTVSIDGINVACRIFRNGRTRRSSQTDDMQSDFKVRLRAILSNAPRAGSVRARPRSRATWDVILLPSEWYNSACFEPAISSARGEIIQLAPVAVALLHLRQTQSRWRDVADHTENIHLDNIHRLSS